MNLPILSLLILSLALFCMGVAGFLIRKNVLSLLICVELMLNAVNISLVSFSRWHISEGGHVLYFLVITIAACETAVGLAILLNFFRLKKSVLLEDARSLQG